MKFELGKQYIVDVSDKGIIPIQEFTHERFFDMDCDPLDVLTDEEKALVVHNVIKKIRAEIGDIALYVNGKLMIEFGNLERALESIDKYKAGEEE